MVKKTLIAYSTRNGINAHAANAISEVLRSTFNADVTTVDLKTTSPDITAYENIIVGGGENGNKVYSEVVDFLGKDFGSKRVALYFSCIEPTKADESKLIENYRKHALTKNPALEPVEIGLFSGCFKSHGNEMLGECSVMDVKAWALKLASELF